MPSQEITGKAFEYACIKALYDKLNSQTYVQLLEDVNFDNTKFTSRFTRRRNYRPS